MGNNVPVVPPNCLDVRKETIDIPSLLEESTVQTSTYLLILSTFPVLLKLVIESDDVHLEFLMEMVDLEGRFDHEVA